MKIVIVGGVAGGATAAARLRRESEDAEIELLERGGHVSFANCGLPYYLGRDIKEREKLLLQTPEGFWRRYRVKVRVNAEVTRLDLNTKTLALANGEKVGFDKLILSQGAQPLRLNFPGVELEHVFSLRDIGDMDAIDKHIAERKPASAVIAGAGFIGLEMAEALRHRGIDRVHLVELGQTPMPLFDPEFGVQIRQELEANGVEFHGGVGLKEITQGECRLSNGATLPAQMVLLSAGVRPELQLARDAGLQLGEQGGLRVNEYLATSHPDVFAVGDMVEIQHRVLNKVARVPLAGPANRQGRIAAMNALGRRVPYRGAIGSSVVKIFSQTAASTGLTEGQAERAGLIHRSVTVHGRDHAGYYPGATPLHLKLIFDPRTLRILGAEAFGKKGVEKRIDVIATAILGGLTVDQLAEVDLCYAPPYGSANDPVNIVCFVAGNSASGFSPTVTAKEFFALGERTQVLDVRTAEERQRHGSLERSHWIPIDELRARLGELDRGKPTVVHCQVGFRGHQAARILKQNGFSDVANLTGGWESVKLWKAAVTE